MTTIETRVQDAVLTTIEILVIPRVKLAMKLTNASSGWSADGNVLDPNQRDFLGNVEGLQMTASSRKDSRTDVNMIDETRDNITIEEGDLVVNEKKIDRQLHTHHNLITLHLSSFSKSNKSTHYSIGLFIYIDRLKWSSN